VPTKAKIIERMDRIFSVSVMFFVRRPRCRSQRSDAKDRSRNTVVTTDPAMKRGLRSSAPTSEMYAIDWYAPIEA
jgi:hypothetical protein